MRERIMEYLENGVPANRLPSILGVTAEYVNSVTQDADFKAELTEKMHTQSPVQDEKRLEVKYAAVEHEILNEMSKKLSEAELPALSHALRTISDVRLKGTMAKNPNVLQPNGIYQTIVNVTLPAHALPHAPHVQLNSQGEILSINNNNLAPLSSEGVKNLFARRQAERGAMTQTVVPKLNAVPADF